MFILKSQMLKITLGANEINIEYDMEAFNFFWISYDNDISFFFKGHVQAEVDLLINILKC